MSSYIDGLLTGASLVMIVWFATMPAPGGTLVEIVWRLI